MPADEVNAPALAERDFRRLKERFLDVNEARLERARSAMRPRQRDFLDILPLLFHINHPMLPGFTSKDVPAGIRDYRPDAPALGAAQRLARTFDFRKQGAVRSYDILALYFMGSAGTVAYSDKSDFDVWLCHDPRLDQDGLAALQEKASAIEQWAEELDLEVHFFLVNHETFRKGEIAGLSEESSGSAQHSLLLDEFYRTGLLLAGHYPLWWLVPPDQEGRYDAIADELREKQYRHTGDHIDFGSLANIPAEEFFGAALWQLYKGIDAPYKSVLKLALIEAYAAEYPSIKLLSRQFKRAVYQGEDDLDLLDPYICMLQKVERYFGSRGEQDRLDLTRRCFYFKADMRLSDTNRRNDMGEWQRGLLMRTISGWQWSQTDLLVMDSRDTWKVHRVTEERRLLFEALSASYRFLSEFARSRAGLAISKSDLNILGRKLYAAFERKAGKVDLLKRGIPSDMTEEQLSVHQISGGERHGSWLLFRGLVKPEDRSGIAPLRRSASLIELITWCYFNGIMAPSAAVAFYPRASILTLGDFRVLVDLVRTLFPTECLGSRPMTDFGRPARIVRTAIFVNIGSDPFMALGRAGEQMTSSRSDPLRFGAARKNLLVSIDQVLVNSWQEVLTFRFAGDTALARCLCEYLKWAPPEREDPPEPVVVRGLHSFHGTRIADRVEQLFRDVTECYYGPHGNADSRFILAVENEFQVVAFDGGAPSFEVLDGLPALMRYLAKPQRQFTPVVIDRFALRETVLPQIYRANRPGIIQLFFRPSGETAELYVLDERGSLFFQRIPFHNSAALINHFNRFFESVMNRINFLMQEGQAMQGPDGLEFYAIVTDRQRGTRLEQQAPAFGDHDRHYMSIQVIVDVVEDGKTVFALYCDGREFSTLEHGAGLFNAVVRHVLELREGGRQYPIYITDIGMSRAVLGEGTAGRIQTAHFLSYKRRIEEQLNRSMANMDAG